MASMTCVTPHPALGGTSRGFSLAADILLHRAHVVNRRLAAVSLSPLPLPDDRDGIHVEHTAAPHHRPDNHQAVLQREDGDFNGRTRTEPHETSCVDVPLSVESVTQSDEGILMDDVLEAEVTAADVPAAGGWFSEAAGRLCDRLDVSSVAEVASSQQVVALCGPEDGPRKLWLRKLVPRQAATPAEYDLVIKGASCVAFLPLQKESRLVPSFPHRLEFSSCGVRLLAPPSAERSPSLLWLQEQVLPKLAKWTVELAGESSQLTSTQSLQLVDADRYHSLYHSLKAKYGAEFVKIWPENTDPQKFVHEDVAIATYLLLLWQQEERDVKQSFVDLGCGNGLLVHILSSEGHPGYGIDVRRRAIWDLYPPSTRLQVDSISPSADTAFADADWLIGNHSDELTPWVPLMAAAGGPRTCFFLLPCCPWDFYSKYQRSDTRVSQYEEYLGYVCRLTERCGFTAETDRLRIPSTRRRCVVGRRRQRAVSDAERRAICAAAGGAAFTPRAAVQPVRNCSQLGAAAVSAAVRRVALRVAESGPLALPAVAELLGTDSLRQLRRQCGGLQTLLRNHAQVFRVRRGQVALQSAEWLRAAPAAAARPELAALLKTSRCLMHEYLSCPLPAAECRYAHGETDLRSAPTAA